MLKTVREGMETQVTPSASNQSSGAKKGLQQKTLSFTPTVSFSVSDPSSVAASSDKAAQKPKAKKRKRANTPQSAFDPGAPESAPKANLKDDLLAQMKALQAQIQKLG